MERLAQSSLPHPSAIQSTDMGQIEVKRELRQTVRERIRALSTEEKFLMDMRLHQNLAEHPWIREAGTILSFCSTREEPDTHWLTGWAFAQGKRVALPVCLDEGQMEFYLLRTPEDFQRGKFGIQEPIGRDRPVLTERTVCIVPGLAFTEDGKRLGKGGGYYDRFLAQHPALRTIGLTYCCLLQEDIPCEGHDIGVMQVVTDQRPANIGR